MEQGGQPDSNWECEYQDNLAQIADDLAFIQQANTGGEYMSDEDQERIHKFKNTAWFLYGQTTPLLSDNLTIARGTLTAEEQEIINRHIETTIAMLEKIKFPKYLKNVPEYAGGHHEKMDGAGTA